MTTKKQLEQAIIDSNEWITAMDGINLLYHYFNDNNNDSYKKSYEIINKILLKRLASQEQS
jgi:hypothetical protein